MPLNPSRRRLILGQRADRPPPVRPPWSTEASIAAQCTGCGDCAVACPEQIVRLDARSRPELDFGRGACTFCGACAEACPAAVFVSREAGPAFTHRMAIGAGCLARCRVVCQACGDACPEAAIRFRPVLGGPPSPDLDGERCTGCGACVGICPVGAIGVVQGRLVAADG